jgi:hypothetical protein
MSSFLTSPHARKKRPAAAIEDVSLRAGFLRLCWMSVNRTIGPAIRCGNSATKVVYSSTFRVGVTRRR